VADLSGESTELLQQLIRNACVNDGSVASGQETRSVDTIAAFLGGTGVELRRYEPKPGRSNLVVRIEGSDRSAPSLHLMGHIDVVPANPAGWRHDPFGGELIDGEVWGRGAIDMLSITATMAVAVRRLATSGFRPRGTLVYSAVADEESLGTWGAAWLSQHAWDEIKTDYLITEGGGASFSLAGGGAKRAVAVMEKGSHWVRLGVKGTPGHGSLPFRSDNAVVKAGELARRIADYRAPRRFTDTWRRFVDGLELSPPLRTALLNGPLLELALRRLPLGMARIVDASTHTTFSPNILHGGIKGNVVPDSAEIIVDIRTLPGQGGPEVHAMLRDAAGDLWPSVEIREEEDNDATESSMRTPLWDTLATVTASLVPAARLVPFPVFGVTDARFFRRKGVTAYGYAIYTVPFDQFVSRFHGNDERVDQESLRLSAELWERTLRAFLG